MSTYSSDLRIELIANGAQPGTWGTTTNDTWAYVIDPAISGFQTVAVASANQALTYVSGSTATASANQAIYASLAFTTGLGTAFSVYAPPVPKQYIIWNNSSQSMTLYNSSVIGNTTPAGTGVTIPAGNKIQVFSNGTNFYSVEAANLTGTLAIANGGTGQTTQQTAINALAGATTSGQYLRGNGTNVTMSAIQAADVPTLNQNTTGTAAGLSSTLVVGSGGTGTTSLTGVAYGNGTSAFTAATGAQIASAIGTTTISNATTASNVRVNVNTDGINPYNLYLTGTSSVPTSPSQSLPEYSGPFWTASTNTLDVNITGNAAGATNLLSGGTIASNVTATTQSIGDNSTKVATTAYVDASVVNSMGTCQAFGSSSTFTVPAGVHKVLVVVVGGGGGGSGATTSNTQGCAGGSGGFGQALIAVTPGASISVTIGSGGSGGAVASLGSNYGTAGGTSSFGAYVTATGGSSGTSTVGTAGSATFSGVHQLLAKDAFTYSNVGLGNTGVNGVYDLGTSEIGGGGGGAGVGGGGGGGTTQGGAFGTGGVVYGPGAVGTSSTPGSYSSGGSGGGNGIAANGGAGGSSSFLNCGGGGGGAGGGVFVFY